VKRLHAIWFVPRICNRKSTNFSFQVLRADRWTMLSHRYVDDICLDKNPSELYELGIDVKRVSSSCDTGIHSVG
jgi:hypothetical protein